MHAKIPEKLLAIAEEIATRGEAKTTRLTVLKKWFQRPEREAAFAIWVAVRALAGKGRTAGAAGELFKESRKLFGKVNPCAPKVDRKVAERLYERLREFQSEYKKQQWGSVRIVHHWDLLLVEQALEIYLWYANSPAHGYTLAADYCKHYDPQRWDGLSGPSRGKIMAIAEFMLAVEALEDEPTVKAGR